MKRKCLFISIVLISIMLSGCGKNTITTVEIEQSEEDKNNKDDVLTNAQNEDKDEGNKTQYKMEELVEDAYTRVENIEEEDGFSIDVEYHVPQIVLESEGAKEINRQIQEVCADVTDEDMEYVEWWKVFYQAYLNDDILSLLLEKRSIMSDYQEYYVYNLRLTDGKILNQKDLIEIVGLTEENVLEGVRKEVLYQSDQNLEWYFDSEYYMDKSEETEYLQEMYAQSLKMRGDSIHEDNIHMQLPMFLDENGDLNAIVPINIPAGSGVYEHILKPRMESKAVDFNIDFNNAVYISYKDGSMSIRIEKSEWSQKAFEDGTLEYGREYPVEGIFKDYVCGEFLLVQDGESTLPVFISDDGMVSYIDIYKCAKNGYFCMTEPVYKLKGETQITEKNCEEILSGVEQFAFNAFSGFSKATMGLYEAEGFAVETNRILDGDMVYSISYYMGFDFENEDAFLYQESNLATDEYYGYEGECKFIGMSEKGMIYAYDAEGWEAGDSIHGVFLIKMRDEWNENMFEWNRYTEYTTLAGFHLFESDEEKIQLSICVG